MLIQVHIIITGRKVKEHQTASHNLFFVFGSLARQSSKCAHNVHLFCLSYRAVSDTRVVAVLPIGAFFRGEIMIIIKMIPPFRPWRYCTFCLFHPPQAGRAYSCGKSVPRRVGRYEYCDHIHHWLCYCLQLG